VAALAKLAVAGATVAFAATIAFAAAVAFAAAIAFAAAVAADTAIGDEKHGERGSVRDGVFTEAQAARGRAAYTGPCSHCHGYKLDGAPDDPDMFPSPPVAGPKFLRKWQGRSLGALLEYVRTTMPASNPGYLSDQEYADVIAYMLSMSGLPSGSAALPADLPSLSRVTILPPDSVGAASRPRSAR
jgi:cytochrome c